MTAVTPMTAVTVTNALPAETHAAIETLVSNGLKTLDDYAGFDQEHIDQIVAKASAATDAAA